MCERDLGRVRTVKDQGAATCGLSLFSDASIQRHTVSQESCHMSIESIVYRVCSL